MEEILLGTVDRTILVYIPDPASTDGSGKTGLVAANLTVSYTRVESDNDVTVTDVTSSLSDLSALTDAHADWGLKQVSSTLAPGLYRLDIADAVFASGAWEAVVYVMITSSAAAATPKAFKLVDVQEVNVTKWLGTALATPTVAGVPEVDLTHLVGVAQSATDLKDFADDGYDPSTNSVAGVVNIATILTDLSYGNEALKALIDTVNNFLDTEITDIRNRLPAALTGAGNMKSDPQAIAGSGPAATSQKNAALAIVTGVVGAGSTTTSVVTSSLSPAATVTDQFKDTVIIFRPDTTTANLRGVRAAVSANTTGASAALTVSTLPATPVSTDAFDLF